MKETMLGGDAVNYLVGENGLLDTELLSYGVMQTNSGVSVEMILTARPGAESTKLRLEFTGIVECGLYYSEKYFFYNVAQAKVLVTDDGFFYVSLDPDTTEMGPSSADQDFVKARAFSLHLTNQD